MDAFLGKRGLSMRVSVPQKNVAIGYMPLLYMVLVVLVLTLDPFRFSIKGPYNVQFSGPFRDIVENILLFAPLGFLLRAGRRKILPVHGMDALVLGLLFSTSIEGLQLLLPQRVTTLSDVLANALGAWAGAVLYEMIRRRMDEHRVVKVLSLDLPLATLIYLFIPLIWLNGFCSIPQPSRVVLIVFPVLIFAVILSSIHDHRVRNKSGAFPLGTMATALAYLLLSLMPILGRNPRFVIEMMALCLGFIAYRIIRAEINPHRERRFELPTLKKVLPLYAVYLVLLGVWPFPYEFGRFEFLWGFDPLFERKDAVFYLRLEMIAAFSVFGYMAAELRTRKEEPGEHVMANVVVFSGIYSAVVELVRGFRLGMAFSVAEGLLFVFAGCFGGMIYLSVARAFAQPE